MEVLVEILLALLAQPSHLMRQVARTVFSHVCVHLTPRALQLILDVSWVIWGRGVWDWACHRMRASSSLLNVQSGWEPSRAVLCSPLPVPFSSLRWGTLG